MTLRQGIHRTIKRWLERNPLQARRYVCEVAKKLADPSLSNAFKNLTSNQAILAFLYRYTFQRDEVLRFYLVVKRGYGENVERWDFLDKSLYTNVELVFPPVKGFF